MWYLIFQAEIYLLCLDLSYNTSILFMLYEHALLLNMSYYLLILDCVNCSNFVSLPFRKRLTLFSQIQIPLPYHTLQLTKNVGV